jgi:hypothetical protein
MTGRFLFAAIGAAAAFLALDWFLNGYFLVAAAILLLAAAWLFAEARRKRRAASIGLVGAIICASAADLLNLTPALLVPGLALALAAWDLSDFERRLDFAAQPEDRPTLERTHLLRLGSVLVIGIVLSEIALSLAGIRITFEWTVIFIVLGAWGLTTLIGWLRARAE